MQSATKATSASLGRCTCSAAQTCAFSSSAYRLTLFFEDAARDGDDLVGGELFGRGARGLLFDAEIVHREAFVRLAQVGAAAQLLAAEAAAADEGAQALLRLGLPLRMPRESRQRRHRYASEMAPPPRRSL